jgi:uncharacterized protein YdiU (UPF0061 family)
MPLRFDNAMARLGHPFCVPVRPTPVRAPRLLAWNKGLADELGADDDDARLWAGNAVVAGADPVALAYAGHQFGHFVPQLGDGRAILLGEAVTRDGRRLDVQWKGSGRTPFSRGGDGRAAVGPVLREFLVSEAMHALGIPTTRALAAVATGEAVRRATDEPGAVLTRVAASHLRVGTFAFFAARRDATALRVLTDVALARHHPDVVAPDAPVAERALALLDAVVAAQAGLVARWCAVGFVHGVMNTDNCAISGETLDYGPCAFLDAFDPGRTFSSIDRQGRYAFGNQPRIAEWNMARLAESLVLLVDDGEHPDDATLALLHERVARFAPAFAAAHGRLLADKIALDADDAPFALALLQEMAKDRADFTAVFRRLADVAEGADGSDDHDGGPADEPVLSLFADARPAVAAWLVAWRRRLGPRRGDAARHLRARNPAVIPRNAVVEAALAAAARGDLRPFDRLRAALARPFDDVDDNDADLVAVPGDEQWRHVTFCGT